jgi:KDO2-lipid IV(A) lauroyltransferase
MLIALFRLLSLIPLPLLHSIGAGLGWLAYLSSPTYRQRLQHNIQQAGFSKYQFKAISEAGKGILELPFIWYASRSRVLKTITVKNWQVAQDALSTHQGIIFLTPHLGCFEVAAQAAAVKIPLTALYRPPRKKILQPLLEHARARENLSLAPANLTGVRQMAKALKKGGAVGLLPDQTPHQGEGVWADFFGQPAYTMTLPSKLHHMTEAPIILSYAERLSWGRGFIVHFISFSTLTGATLTGTLKQQATQINYAMEQLISRCPAQYLWSYHRYKTPANVKTSSPSIVEENK